MTVKLRHAPAEQAFADVAAWGGPGRHGEEGAADVLDVLVERVHRAEPPLDRDELVGVALEADEEEPGFELAETLVDAVGERVAAAEDAGAVVLFGGGEADVGIGRDYRMAVALLVQRQRFELIAAAEWGAAVLVAADRPLLVSQWGPVPDLEQHPDPACDQEAAAPHPGRPLVADPDEPLHRLAVLGADVGGAVLHPHQVSRRVLAAAGTCGAADTELGPAHRYRAAADPGQVADRVEGDLGVVGAGLDADVAAAFG